MHTWFLCAEFPLEKIVCFRFTGFIALFISMFLVRCLCVFFGALKLLFSMHELGIGEFKCKISVRFFSSICQKILKSSYNKNFSTRSMKYVALLAPIFRMVQIQWCNTWILHFEWENGKKKRNNAIGLAKPGEKAFIGNLKQSQSQFVDCQKLNFIQCFIIYFEFFVRWHWMLSWIVDRNKTLTNAPMLIVHFTFRFECEKCHTSFYSWRVVKIIK